MACKQNKVNNSNCGCANSALTTQYPCPPYKECNDEPCAEMFCTECIINCGEEISVATGTSKTLTFKRGERLSDFIQKFLVSFKQDGEVDAEYIPSGIKVSSKTSSTITVKFNLVTNHTYSVSYRKSSETTVTTKAVTTKEFTLEGLTSNTVYVIYLTDTTTTPNVESVMLNVKTNIE